jgi:hypothetical protein
MSAPRPATGTSPGSRSPTGFLTFDSGVHAADEDALLTLHGPRVTQYVRLTYVLMLATTAGTLTPLLALSAYKQLIDPRWTHLLRTVGTHRVLIERAQHRLTNIFLTNITNTSDSYHTLPMLEDFADPSWYRYRPYDSETNPRVITAAPYLDHPFGGAALEVRHGGLGLLDTALYGAPIRAGNLVDIHCDLHPKQLLEKITSLAT